MVLISCLFVQDFFDRGPVQSPAAPTVGQDVFDLLGGFNGPSSEQNYQGSENLGDLEFDPFANVGEPGAPQVADTQVSSSPFTALPAEQFDQGQHGMVARPRPGTSGQVPMGLPPPPTKQSIKAANRSKAASPPPVTSPVSPPAPTTSASKLTVHRVIVLLMAGLSCLTLSLPSSKSTFSQPSKEKCISEVARICSIIIFHLSK